jgi:hypothetical protein
VDDADFFPVGALGSAVWALAQTDGGLDSTTITGPSAIFNGQQLSNLPALLAAQQILAGPKIDSFFYDFAHTDGGYTEDTAFGLLGLEAANAANPSLGYGPKITAGQAAISGAVDGAGSTYLTVTQTSPSYNVYTGRFLQAVPEPASATLLLVGAAGLLIGRKRRGSK